MASSRFDEERTAEDDHSFQHSSVIYNTDKSEKCDNPWANLVTEDLDFEEVQVTMTE